MSMNTAPATLEHQHCYQFAKTAIAFPPETDTTALMNKAFKDAPLTRAEKDTIAERLYGVCGMGESTYRSRGWAWPMSQAKQMRRILVAFRYESGTFRTYYAADKTALRNALSVPSQIDEMIYAPTTGDAAE